jgi:HTH-type transcriptional regulator / antitoxin HigA
MVKNEYTPEEVSPPGETLAETLDAIGMTQAELALRTGRPLKTINEIIQGKAAITAETALQLERVLNVPAAFWNNREAQYREALARRARKADLEKYVDRLDEVPYAAMAKLGWVAPAKDPVAKLDNLLSFFGVASVPALDNLVSGAQFRRSSAYTANRFAILAWLRHGRVGAERIVCAPYNEALFRRVLHEVRALTVTLPDGFDSQLVTMCARAGVAVVFTRELPKTHVSGAARWLTSEKAVIQITLRYKTDDQFWFTFFHEAAHILLHGRREGVFIDKNIEDHDESVHLDGMTQVHDDKVEQEANAWASDFLIPRTELKNLPRPPFSRQAIAAFANRIGISPGIVVGRLQHDGLLPFTHMHDLKRKLIWAEDAKQKRDES